MCFSKVTMPDARHHQTKDEVHVMTANGFIPHEVGSTLGYRLFLKYGEGYHSLFALDRQNNRDGIDKEYYKNTQYSAVVDTAFSTEDAVPFVLGFFVFPEIKLAKKYLFSILRSPHCVLPHRNALEEVVGTNTDYQIVMCQVAVSEPNSFGITRTFSYVSTDREELPAGCFNKLTILKEFTPHEVAEERLEC